MPSKHMLPKGKRRQSVRAQYRAARDAQDGATPDLVARDAEPATQPPTTQIAGPVQATEGTRVFVVSEAAAGMRLDAFLVQAIPDISRARAQMLIEAGRVRLGAAAAKA